MAYRRISHEICCYAAQLLSRLLSVTRGSARQFHFPWVPRLSFDQSLGILALLSSTTVPELQRSREEVAVKIVSYEKSLLVLAGGVDGEVILTDTLADTLGCDVSERARANLKRGDRTGAA